MFYLLLVYIFIHAGTDACMRSKAVVKVTCPLDIHVTADRSSTSTLVAWGRKDFQIDATHPIQGLYQTVPVYGASATVSRTFHEGSQQVEYKAVDEGGNFASCSFQITVNVVRCDRLFNPNPHIGRLQCAAGNVYGSSCTLTCNEGYSVVGERDIECKRSGHWSADIPFCQITTCPDPGTPLHGTRFCTTVNHAYGSVCSFSCANGYQVVGKDKLICAARNNGTGWLSDTPNCGEIKSPTVEACPSDIQVTTSQAQTQVTRPHVEFLTSEGLDAPYTCSHFGDRKTHFFNLGIHVVTCTAYDPNFGQKATATCQFVIRIKANPCRPLSRPRNGFLLCSRAHGGGSSMHDTACKLFCRKGFTLPRTDGPRGSEFECDHTGNWQPSNHVPSCVRPKRPLELKLPSEIFYTSSNCSSPAPLRDVRVKFQTESQTTIRRQKACALNPGDCIVEDVKTSCRNRTAFDRRRRFVSAKTVLHTHSRHSKYTHNASPRRRTKRNVHSKSSVDLLNSHNSLSSGLTPFAHVRRKRDSDVTPEHLPFILPIQFHFGTRVPEAGGDWPDEYHKASHRLYGMFDYFEQQIVAQQFSINNRVTSLTLYEMHDSLTYAVVEIICDIGYQFNRDILLCVPCGAGTYYSADSDRCALCPIGEYQEKEGQFSCTACPHGSTTLEEGAINVTQCVDVDECVSGPCMNNGECKNGVAMYTCTCQPGYTGAHCEEQVYDCADHACLGGGKCVPEGQTNYTCSCRHNYRGDFCQFHTVDGGWSDWSPWNHCSQSCEGGVTWRNRTCDTPPPSEDGRHCRGATLQERVCNDYTCPQCKRLRRPYQGNIRCAREDDEEVTSCRVHCPIGFAFSGPVFPVYICGPNTSYLWPHESPDNPRCVIPACTRVADAKEVAYTFRSALAVTCPPQETEASLRHQIRKRAVHITSGLSCLKDNSCVLNEPYVTGCRHDISKRKRRGAQLLNGNGSMPETGSGKSQLNDIDIQVTLTYTTPVRKRYRSKTSPAKENAHMAATTAELLALSEDLLGRSRQGALYVVVDGRRVAVDAQRTRADNTLVCPQGMAALHDEWHCGECRPGSFYHPVLRACAPCPLGSYQPRAARLSCEPCPLNMTTFGRGAILELECYKNGSSPPVIPDKVYEALERDDATFPPALVAVIAVLTLVATVSGVVIIAVFARRRREVKYNVDKKIEVRPEEMRLYTTPDTADRGVHC